MKFVVFGPDARLGLVTGERVLDLARAASATSPAIDERIFGTLLSLIEADERGLDLARQLAERFAGADHPGLYAELGSVQLHAPFPGRRMALAGSNFAAHVANAYTNFGKPTTAAEVLARIRQGKAGGFWSVSPPVGPGAAIPFPRSAKGLFDFEGELAIVLRKGGKGLSADGWTDQVWGTTLLIDWSVRNQNLLSGQRPFYAHKVFDCSKSIGPWIQVGEVDPASWDIETRVNGELRQRFNTRDMMHGFGELLEQMSEDLTLLPGDMLSSGTGPGTAADTTVPGPDGQLPLDLFLKPGDIVEVSAAQLGTLNGHVTPND